MSKINVELDTETRTCTLSVDGTTISGTSDFSISKYRYMYDDKEEEYIYFSVTHEADDGMMITKSFRFSKDMAEEMENDDSVYSAIASAIRANSDKNKLMSAMANCVKKK